LFFFHCFGLSWLLVIELSFLAVHFLFSPDRAEKVSGNFATGPRHDLRAAGGPRHDLRAAGLACGKRLATGAVALQRNVVRKACARAGVDVDLANKLKRQIQSLAKETHGAQAPAECHRTTSGKPAPFSERSFLFPKFGLDGFKPSSSNSAISPPANAAVACK
jgi:hypothetical protein